MSEKLRLQREQLREIVGDDPDAIRVFERLLSNVNSLQEPYVPRVVRRNLTSTNKDARGLVLEWLHDSISLPPALAPATPFLSWDAGYQEFTFTEDGMYQIFVSLSIGSRGTPASVRQTYELNIERWDGSAWAPEYRSTAIYFRDVDNDAERGHGSVFAVEAVTAGTKYRTHVDRYLSSGDAETNTDGSWITITRLGEIAQ
jgi:hypothetical protein